MAIIYGIWKRAEEPDEFREWGDGSVAERLPSAWEALGLSSHKTKLIKYGYCVHL